MAHLLRERDMLTSDSKFHWWPGSDGKLTAKRNFKFGVNIILSQSRWATLYIHLSVSPIYLCLWNAVSHLVTSCPASSSSCTALSDVTPKSCDGSSKTFSRLNTPFVTFCTCASRNTSSDCKFHGIRHLPFTIPTFICVPRRYRTWS